MKSFRESLRPHQTRAINLLVGSIREGNKRTMIQAPTGFGKTVVGGAIVEGALEKGNRVMFIVPAISLIDQTVEKFAERGILEVGVIQANHPLTNWNAPVQIASIQTLQKRPRLPDVDFVVIDEAHKWFKFYEKLMSMWNALIFIGLSATPWTKGLGKHYQNLIIASTTQELIDQGYLSPFRVYAPSKPDLSKCRTVAGDYHEGDLGEVMNDSSLTADIVTTWKRLGKNEPTLCFCVDRAHAKHVAEQFKHAGVTTGYIDAYTDLDERRELGSAFEKGHIKVICNVGCLTTGVDWDVRCIILARPTKSEILFTQIIGRGLRTADGKTECIILDHSNTHLNLGFVTDIQHEKLCDGKHKESKSERKEALPKECPSCKYLKAPKVHQCPACGFKPEAKSDIETEAGELEELTSKPKYTMEQKADWHAMIKSIQLQRGYSDGWTANTYRKKFGVWPKNIDKHATKTPSQEVAGFIKHLQIKFAKRKAA